MSAARPVRAVGHEDYVATCVSVVKIYATATGEVHALKGIDALFARATVTAVVGPSGSGKSSLLRILAGRDVATAGRVLVRGTEIGSLTPAGLRGFRRREMSYVFQRPSDNLLPQLTAREHVVHAGRLRGVAVPDPGELLGSLGLGHRLDHRPRELSGGEQQRLAFVVATVGEPALIVADEPTAELDHASADRLLEVVHRIADDGATVIVASHDPRVTESADRVLALRHGAVETEHSEGRLLSVIDGVGRVQLPPEALELFPDRRATVELDHSGVRIVPS